MNNVSKSLLLIAASAATGFVLGILFAPDSGKNIQRKINDEGKKLTDDIKYRFRKRKEQLSDLKDEIENKINEKIDEFA